jgi:hypothetical protein
MKVASVIVSLLKVREQQVNGRKGPKPARLHIEGRDCKSKMKLGKFSCAATGNGKEQH